MAYRPLSLEKRTAMKCFLGLSYALLFSFAAAAQKEIRPEEVAGHVGDSVTVTGKVAGGRYFSHSEGAPTLLNIGAPYPDQLFTVVIRGAARKELGGAPERDLLDKNLRVSGRVELYKEKPQIVVYRASQLTVAEPVKTGAGQQ